MKCPGQGDEGCLSHTDMFLCVENILCCFHLRCPCTAAPRPTSPRRDRAQHCSTQPLVNVAKPQMRTLLAGQDNCNYPHSLARKTAQNQPVLMCLCIQGVTEAMVKRMNLLNLHGNTREWLHLWRKLPKNRSETLGRGSSCQGKSANGHSQGTAQLLQHCISQEVKEEPSQTGGLEAEKAMEQALEKEPAELEHPQDTRQP